MSLMLLSSAFLTVVAWPNLLFCLVLFFVKMCLLYAFLRLILPLPVTLKRFLAPDFVFNLGITYKFKNQLIIFFLLRQPSYTCAFLPALAIALLCLTLPTPGQILTGVFRLFPYTQSTGLQNEHTPLLLRLP